MVNGSNYANLRSETAFRWYVSSPFYVFWGLVDIPIEEGIEVLKCPVDYKTAGEWAASITGFWAHWP